VGDGPDTQHGTAIAVSGRAALIVGPSGAGKSDLALRCLAVAPTALIPAAAQLVGDDRVIISPWRHLKRSGSIGLDMAIHYADIVEYLLGPEAR